jgi:hypothetical protein
MALDLIPAKEYEKDRPVEIAQEPKKPSLQAIPVSRPMSRSEIAAFGITDKTSLKQRTIITDTLRRQFIRPEPEPTGVSPAKDIMESFGAIGAGTGGFRPTMEQRKDLARVVPEIPGALAAGVQRDILGAPGKAIQFVGEKLKARKIPIGAQAILKIADKTGFAGGVKLYDKISNTVTNAGKFISEFWEEQASTGWEAPDPELMEQKWNQPLQYGTRITMESAPTFLAAIGAGYVTGSPNVSLAMMGAFEKLNSFTKQMEGGASFQKANIISTMSGTWEAVTEKIPFDFILKGGGKSRLIKAVTAGGLESLQELLAGMGQNFLEHFGYNAKNWKTIPGAIKEGLKHTFDNWLESVVAGGVLGAGAGGVFTGRTNKELNEVAKRLGVPIKGLTPEAAVRKIDQVMENRRAIERVDEETDPEALNALAELAPSVAEKAPEPPVQAETPTEAPIGKEERETLREMGLSIEEIGKTPAKDLRARINKRARRHAGGFLNIPVETPEPGKVRETAEAIYQDYVNRFASIENITKKAKKLGMVIPPGEDPAMRARAYLGMGRKVESVLRDKTFRINKKGNIIITGEGLKPILDSYDKTIRQYEKKRKPRQKDFEDYLIAQRTILDLQRPAYEGAPHLIVTPAEVAKAEKQIKALESKYGKDGMAAIEKHAQRLYSFQKRVLHSLVDAGNISQKLYDKIVRDNPHYIPFDRVLDQDTFAGTPVSRKRFTEARAPVRKIKGGKGLAIQPPIETVIKNTYKILEAAERNHVTLSIAKLQNVIPGINPVRVKMFPIKVDPKEILTIAKEFRSKSAKVVEEVKKIRTEKGEDADVSGPVAKLEKVVKDALTHRGFSEGESNAFIAQIRKGKPAEGDAPTHTTETIRQIIKETQHVITSKEPVESTIFRPSQFKPKGRVIEYYENGKRKYIEVSPNLYKAMTGLTEDGASFIVRILAKPAHWLRVGATITPEFMARNPLRDTYTALMQTSFGFIPFYDQVGAIADILGKTDVYHDWFRSGGAYSGFVELSRPALAKANKELQSSRGRKLLSKLNVIADAEDVSQLLEQATRLAVYKRAIRKGLSPVEAGFESREATVDFARRGAKMGDVNKLVAFFNASIQGFDKTIRNSIKHPYSTAMKGTMAITLPSLLLYLRNRDDPEYAEIAQWQKDLFWIVRVGDTHLRIPKPFLYGQVFGSLPERFFEYLDTKDRKAFDGLATSMIESASPVGLNPVESVIPTAVKPIIENMTNYNFFRERTVVPEHLIDLPAEEQYSRYTTETAKQLGEWMNYSPAKIENLIYGYTGGTGRHILQGTDFLVNSIKAEEVIRRPKELADIPLVKGFVTRPAIGPSAESVSNFYEDSKPIIAQRSSFNRKVKQGKGASAKNLLEGHPEIRIAPTLVKFQTALSELSKLADRVAETKMDTEDKRKRLKQIDQQRVDLARRANEIIGRQ